MVFTSEFMNRVWEIRKALKVDHKVAFKMAKKDRKGKRNRVDNTIATLENMSFPTVKITPMRNSSDLIRGICRSILGDGSLTFGDWGATATVEDPNNMLSRFFKNWCKFGCGTKESTLGDFIKNKLFNYVNHPSSDYAIVRDSTFKVQKTSYGWLITREYR